MKKSPYRVGKVWSVVGAELGQVCEAELVYGSLGCKCQSAPPLTPAPHSGYRTEHLVLEPSPPPRTIRLPLWNRTQL